MDALIVNFCQQQRELLELELQQEEGSRNAGNDDASSVQVLHQIVVRDVSVGLYGRTVVEFVSAKSNGLLPAHRFTTGDEVEIRSSNQKKSNSWGGVVSAVTETSLSVALFGRNKHGKKSTISNTNRKVQQKNDDDDSEMEDGNLLGGTPPYSMYPMSNIEVHRKYLQALTKLEKSATCPSSVVRALFFSNQSLSSNTNVSFEPINTSLDASQLDAIGFCLSDHQPISLIHGPPGTGKTTTVVELIRQAVLLKKWKVLVTAPSNVAVDNVLAKLVESFDTKSKSKSKRKQSQKNYGKNHQHDKPFPVVRLGHPARLQPAILPYSLEALVQASDGTEIVADVRKELQSYLEMLQPTKNRNKGKQKYSNDQRRLAYRQIQGLRNEIRTREEKVVRELLSSASVVLSTCVGAANSLLWRKKEDDSTMAFDLVIVDEAAQALEAACWIPILQARTKVVLAGDHCQLPPTIQSNNPLVMKGLGETMFERVMKLYGDDTQEYNQSTRGESVGRVSRMLNVQYRMHENIANWASQALYGGKLQSHDSVKHRTLASLTDIHTDKSLVSIKDVPLLLIDTAGCAMYESENAAGSRFNEGEAELVIEHVRKLINMGIQQDQIAVITPYNGQVEVLKLALLPEAPKLQIRSVDGFQGGEREAVVLSLVRSSERGGIGGIGFLRDDRRLNVAVTRAKRHCCLICDTETVSQSPFVKNLIEWIEEHGEQRSALEMRNMVLNRDLLQAELEVQIMESLALEKNRAMQNAKHPIDPVDADRRRGALYEVIQNFIATGQPGDEMALSSELTKLDRKIIHEIAEEFNLEHRSEGIEGKDRRIILGVQKPCALPGNEGISITPATLAEHQEPQRGTPTSKDDSDLEVDLLTTDFNSQQQFHALTALQLEDDNSEARESSVSPTPELQQDTNLLLAGLARERAQRDRTRQQQQVVEAVQKKVRKQKKGQKLGGTKKITEKRTEPECFADFNDMAYLDAHIEQVQTSHGRKVEGSGSNYRTIINGVLLGKPKQDVKQKNSQVSATLQAKLKQAQDGRRKAKTKKR